MTTPASSTPVSKIVVVTPAADYQTITQQGAELNQAVQLVKKRAEAFEDSIKNGRGVLSASQVQASLGDSLVLAQETIDKVNAI